MKMIKIVTKLSLGAFVIGLLLPVSQADAAVLNLLNPGFEQPGANAQNALSWQPYQNGYTRTTTAHTGRFGIRLRNTNKTSYSGAYQRIDLNQTTMKPVLVEAYVRGSSIVNSQGGYFGAGIYAEIVLNDGTIAYWNSLANYGTFNWRWIGFNTGVLPHINKPISHIFVVPILGLASGTAYFDDVKVTELDPHQSAVTFMIDDGEDNAYTAAKPILDSAGFDATVAVPSSVVGAEGYMTRTQLQGLQSSGWEIMSHSVNHVDLTLLSAAQAYSELRRSKLALERLGLVVKNFAFPYGAYNSDLIYNGGAVYRSLRPYELGDNPQGVFTPHEVKVRSVVNTTTVAEIQDWIAEAQVKGRWVVLAFHSITETGDDAYHTSPAMFQDIVDAVTASGVPVVTYDKGLDLFGAPH